MTSGDPFVPASNAWVARPADPHDVFVAQRILPGSEAPRGAVGLFGVPFDGAVLGRPGAREGPGAIRAAMARLKPWSLADGEPARPLADWGDVRVVPDDVDATHAATEAAARAVLDAGHFPLALGGDHSLTYALVKAHAGRARRLGVVNLDAHLDVREPVGGFANSGTSFRRLMDLGLVRPENLVEVGVRDFANSAAYADRARREGVTILGADAWRRDPEGVVREAVARAADGADGVYLSLDLDVLDQAYAPGVSAPTPGGVDTGTLFDALRRIAQEAPLVGADVVEMAPPLDREGLTARAAAFAVMRLLAALPRRA